MCLQFALDLKRLFYQINDVKLKREGLQPSPNVHQTGPQCGSPDVIQAHAASLLPQEQWKTDFTALHWNVKWQAKKGLQLLCPQITWTGPGTAIPTGKALLLTRLE